MSAGSCEDKDKIAAANSMIFTCVAMGVAKMDGDCLGDMVRRVLVAILVVVMSLLIFSPL